MSKASKGRKSAEAEQKLFNPIDARQAIADHGSTPEFEENHQRLRAERLAREAKARQA